MVHCRTGSLEINMGFLEHSERVHCRTGSLENGRHNRSTKMIVHCRTGSLEIIIKALDK